MSDLPFFTVDSTLGSELQEFYSSFRGDGENSEAGSADSSATGSLVDIDQTSPDVSDEEEDAEHFLDRTVDVDGIADQYFDGEDAGEAINIGAEVQCAGTHCGCTKNCLQQFDLAQVEQNKLNFMELPKEEKDLMVLGLLESFLHSPETTWRGGKRRRQHFKYTYRGQSICVGAFRYLYDIGTKRLDNLHKHLEANGLQPRVHGNKSRRPKHAITLPVVRQVLQFLSTYSDEHGIPHPAPLHGRADVPPIYLPASDTVLSIHRLYVRACQEADHRAVGYESFRLLWKECLAHLKIMSPRTDVCEKCEFLRRGTCDAVTDNEKLASTAAFGDHIHGAQRERKFYRDATLLAKEELAALANLPQPPLPACSQPLRRVHVTFDFAQNVCLPQSSRQEGPLYFKTARKVHIFGVNLEAFPRQINYLIDEADTIGFDGKNSHGPNSVASLLHHFFATYGLGERECFLHADNCAGQNKNKTMIAYFAWRVLHSLHCRITLSFMLTGHTRCLVDGCFGLLKQKFRRSNCYSLDQLEAVVNTSTNTDCNVAHRASDGVVWRQWDSFLVGHFKPIKGIRGYHHFVFDSERPGVVMVKETVDGPEQEVSILTTSKAAVLSAGLPDILPAAGLSLQRQQYLFKQVRPHVPAAYQDVLCPAPPPAATPVAAADDAQATLPVEDMAE